MPHTAMKCIPILGATLPMVSAAADPPNVNWKRLWPSSTVRKGQFVYQVPEPGDKMSDIQRILVPDESRGDKPPITKGSWGNDIFFANVAFGTDSRVLRKDFDRFKMWQLDINPDYWVSFSPSGQKGHTIKRYSELTPKEILESFKPKNRFTKYLKPIDPAYWNRHKETLKLPEQECFRKMKSVYKWKRDNGIRESQHWRHKFTEWDYREKEKIIDDLNQNLLSREERAQVELTTEQLLLSVYHESSMVRTRPRYRSTESEMQRLAAEESQPTNIDEPAAIETCYVDPRPDGAEEEVHANAYVDDEDVNRLRHALAVRFYEKANALFSPDLPQAIVREIWDKKVAPKCSDEVP